MKKLIQFIIFLCFVKGLLADGYTVKYKNISDNFFLKPNPEEKIWDNINEFVVELMPQNITTPSLQKRTVPFVKVKAIHNKKYIAILLEWLDPTKNDITDVDKASDACAIQFPRKDFNSTSPFMGHEGAPVVIFHWKAIWNRDIEKGYVKLEDIHPNAFTETYMFGKEIAREANNPISKENRISPVEELHAEGFGTSTHAEEADIRAWGIKTLNGWKVMFTYKFDSELIPTLKPGSNTGIAFAIWGGNNKDIGARKNYAPWQPIYIE
ncbi:MAG: hypothetical protein KatS3mg129_3020 [Leptospiraceae bacterium]|nr:MAG: hypothetical protein KatS3mg129_3020 [Leptospiraceae bacterium]